MDFLDVVHRRRMVRRFSDEPVPFEAVQRIIDVARCGPSAGYSQGVEFVAVTDPATRDEISRIVSNRETASATMSRIPVHIVLCVSADIYKARYRQEDKQSVRAGVSDDDLWHVPFWHVDAGAAMMLLLLGTVNEGLSAGFIGVWRPDQLRVLLGIPKEYTITGVAFVGHRAEEERAQGSVTSRRRRPIEEVLHKEHW